MYRGRVAANRLDRHRDQGELAEKRLSRIYVFLLSAMAILRKVISSCSACTGINIGTSKDHGKGNLLARTLPQFLEKSLSQTIDAPSLVRIESVHRIASNKVCDLGL